MIGNSAFSPFPRVAGMQPGSPLQQRMLVQAQQSHAVMPARGWAPARIAPAAPPPWTAPNTGRPNYAAHAFQQQLALRRQQAAQQSAWRGRPPAAPVVNNYYAPAPITEMPAPVAMTTPSPMMVVPPSMPEPQPNVSPASPTADLGPTQDAHEAVAEAAAPPTEHPGHAWGRKIVIGLVVAGVAFGGYKLYKSHKKPAGHGGGHGHAHGMQGARRRRRRGR